MLYFLAILAAVLRWLPLTRPLFGWLPPRAQWIPSATLAAVGLVASRLGVTDDALGALFSPETARTVSATLEALVAFALAAQAGLHPPAPPSGAPGTIPPSEGAVEAAVGKVGVLVLLVLVALPVALGCSSTSSTPAACAPGGLAALEASCLAALDVSATQCQGTALSTCVPYQATLAGCIASARAWEACGAPGGQNDAALVGAVSAVTQ